MGKEKKLSTLIGNDIKFDWDYFKGYVETYDPHIHGIDNTDVILEDMLYGLAMSVDKEQFSWHNGYQGFKQVLKSWLTAK